MTSVDLRHSDKQLIDAVKFAPGDALCVRIG
jgi:hypothetical protein